MDGKIFLEFKDENNKVMRVIRCDAVEAIEIDEVDKTLIRIFTHSKIFVHKIANEQLAEAELIALFEQVENYYNGICDD